MSLIGTPPQAPIPGLLRIKGLTLIIKRPQNNWLEEQGGPPLSQLLGWWGQLYSREVFRKSDPTQHASLPSHWALLSFAWLTWVPVGSRGKEGRGECGEGALSVEHGRGTQGHW